MLRIWWLLLILCPANLVAAAENSAPLPAKKVQFVGEPVPLPTLARAFQEKSGIELDVSALDQTKRVAADFDRVDFWTAVERLAKRTDSRIVVAGGKVILKPGPSKSPSAVSGAFRFTLREILIRGDVEAGTATYEVVLEVAWEPGRHVYRIDGVPKITAAKDDTGAELSVAAGGSRTLTSGNTATLTVRPLGLTRGVKTLSLKGTVMVTIADRLLTFEFNANGPLGPAPAQEGVSVNLTKSAADGKDWVAEVQLNYPKGEVTWESHEYAWHRNNVMRLLPPKGEPIKADDVSHADFRYGFKNRAKDVGPGWKLDYRTPGPMREIVVPFELKDIKLP
ncbi:MAG TPA: hypothetical protein VKE40_23310 [Gemmataceae bacterium]|nr:hypothetical protein [Gemmataceae bacterium]